MPRANHQDLSSRGARTFRFSAGVSQQRHRSLKAELKRLNSIQLRGKRICSRQPAEVYAETIVVNDPLSQAFIQQSPKETDQLSGLKVSTSRTFRYSVPSIQ